MTLHNLPSGSPTMFLPRLRYDMTTLTLPLCRWSVHDNVDPENLHGIERVGEPQQCGDGDQREGSNAPADKGEETD